MLWEFEKAYKGLRPGGLLVTDDALWNNAFLDFSRKVGRAGRADPSRGWIPAKGAILKLLIYSHAFAPQVGGIETFVSALARELALLRNGKAFAVTVVTQTAADPRQGVTETGFEVVRQPSLWKLWELIGLADKTLLAGPAILPLLFSLIRRKHVIVTHHGYQSICPNGMLFHFPTGRSCVGHFAAGHYMECTSCNRREKKLTGSVRMLVLTFVRRALARCATLNVAVSEHVARRVDLPRMRVIRNGVPTHSYSGSAHIRPKKKEPSCFAYLGRLVTEKGVPVLIRAASILKAEDRSFEVLIIGDGPERPAVQADVAALGLDDHVKFLGFRTGAQLNEIMGRVCALIMPSICEDAAPFSVLEQMMAGRLIIGSDIGGLAEEIGDAGLTFPPADADGLAERMRRVIEQPNLSEQLGEKARQRASQKYSVERMLLEYEEVIAESREKPALSSKNPDERHEWSR